MKLIKKTLEKYNRSLYIYYPEGNIRTPFKRSCITILREDASEASVKELLEQGLAELAEEKKVVLSFPNPTDKGWNYALMEDLDNDMEIIKAMQDALGEERELEPAKPYLGIPTYDMMMNSWHLMNDTKYLIGFGSGASMAYTLAACSQDNIAAIYAVGGNLSSKALKGSVDAAMPVYLVQAGQEAVDFFKEMNQVSVKQREDGYFRNHINPLKCVKCSEKDDDIYNFKRIWEEFFSHVRRPNTGAYGDCEYRISPNVDGFEFFLEDDRLKDGMVHTWFTHLPSIVRNQSKKAVPLLIFLHGGSDNPEEAAEMSKFHELGEREGFITVYPWASNKAGWNMWQLPTQDENMDDVTYILALIDYMLSYYPVDEQRIYLSGFSNGAGMAQTIGMLHPERFAGICHIDSNWPGAYIGIGDFDPETEEPFRTALIKQKSFPYRMPVWYTYGTREPSYPIYDKCSQQHQYDFWKRYNNITIQPTPPKDMPHPSGCGVLGDKTETIKPCTLHPTHQYDIQRFYTEDEGNENLYNFVIMRDKGHDIARMDPELGFNYVKQFKRNPDKTVGRV